MKVHWEVGQLTVSLLCRCMPVCPVCGLNGHCRSGGSYYHCAPLQPFAISLSVQLPTQLALPAPEVSSLDDCGGDEDGAVQYLNSVVECRAAGDLEEEEEDAGEEQPPLGPPPSSKRGSGRKRRGREEKQPRERTQRGYHT